MVREGDLSVAAVHRICKKAGAERVSDSASEELARVLGKVGLEIAKEAIDYMMHAGRRTLRARDIEIVAKKMFESPRF